MSNTYTPRAHLRVPHVNAWLIGLTAIVLLAAAVGAGVLIGRSTKDAQPVQGLASDEAMAVIDGSMDAFRRRDYDAFGAYFAADAIFEEPDVHRTFEGRQAIVDSARGIVTMGGASACYERGDAAAIQVGNRVALVSRTCDGKQTFIDVVRFNDKMEISHWWDIGSGYTPWTGQRP